MRTEGFKEYSMADLIQINVTDRKEKDELIRRIAACRNAQEARQVVEEARKFWGTEPPKEQGTACPDCGEGANGKI